MRDLTEQTTGVIFLFLHFDHWDHNLGWKKKSQDLYYLAKFTTNSIFLICILLTDVLHIRLFTQQPLLMGIRFVMSSCTLLLRVND